MKRETYKGRKIKVVAGRGADWGYTRVTLNGVDMGKSLGNEDGALTSTRSYIDHADEVGVSSARYGAEWYAPGTFELCDEGHAKEIGGECGHTWCVEQRAQDAPVVNEPAPVEHRETTIRVAGVERVIRTEVGGKVRTVKQLEAAHAKSVKAALVEMRKAGAPTLRAKARAVGDGGKGEFSKLAARWERGVFAAHGTPGVSSAPFPKFRFTGEIPEYLTEVAPGHYATAEAAEGLFDVPEVPEPLPTSLPSPVDGESFLDALLKSVA
jgi:hypothetical protein